MTEHAEHPPTVMWTESFWDERYASAPQVWSGNPNPHLVAQIAGEAPGSALDVGAGEGADAIWLAEQGWTVTAIDISTVALKRGEERARSLGDAISARIQWTQVDLLAAPDELPGSAYDLVSSHFMHLPPDDRDRVYHRLAALVAPGGTLLIVGHHPSDQHAMQRSPEHAEMMFTGDQVVDLLDPNSWRIEVNSVPARLATGPDGIEATFHYTLVRATRI
jgi:SAM-dependent methyltransferase